jgi:hypothetical protein
MSLRAIALKCAGSIQQARTTLTDEMIELVSTLQDTCNNEHLDDFTTGLELYLLHCQEMGIPTEAIKLLLSNLKEIKLVKERSKQATT